MNSNYSVRFAWAALALAAIPTVAACDPVEAPDDTQNVEQVGGADQSNPDMQEK